MATFTIEYFGYIHEIALPSMLRNAQAQTDQIVSVMVYLFLFLVGAAAVTFRPCVANHYNLYQLTQDFSTIFCHFLLVDNGKSVKTKDIFAENM